MIRAFSIAATVLLLAACGAETSTSSAGPGASTPTPMLTTPSAAATETPAASPAPTPAATPSPPASASPVAACYPLKGGTASRATVTDVRVGAGAGYERLVVEFDRAVPFYELFPNPDGIQFRQTASGRPVVVAGSAGVVLRLTDIDLPNRYPHGSDLTPRSSVLEEVASVDDFEGVTLFGIGLARDVCPTVSTLPGPPRLVIDFPTG